MPDLALDPDHARTAVVAQLRTAGCVFAEDEAELLIDQAGSPDELAELVARRVAGDPLEVILGWVEFAGLRLVIERGVFVPRRRTEFLARQAVSLAGQRSRPVVLDLCCGNGALAAVVAAEVEHAELYAADVDPAAVECARRNLPATAQVCTGDLFDPLPRDLAGRIDVLVANVPYVPTEAIATMPPEARDHEERSALDGGADGLEVARRVADAAAKGLAPGGSMLVETSSAQAPIAGAYLETVGLRPHVATSEELDATVVIGTR